MTDKELIFDFLKNNYTVKAVGKKYFTFDKVTNSPVFKHSFIKDIFGNFRYENGKSTVQIYNHWLRLEKAKLARIADKFINNLDYSKGSIALLEELKEMNSNQNNNISNKFLEIRFSKFYIQKFLKPKLDEIFQNFNKNGNSKTLVSIFYNSFHETDVINKISVNYLNGLYHDNIIEQKLNNILYNYPNKKMADLAKIDLIFKMFCSDENPFHEKYLQYKYAKFLELNLMY